jgi:acetylornithine deacetylase/succinyl-diaminopimelate desuccinylase-like protein
VASLYVDVRTVPGQDPLAVKEEIRDWLAKAGVPASTIELYHFRRGYEAKNIDRLADSVRRAHVANFGSDPKPAFTATSSMWRDINVFNEVGIPALTYGPRSERHSFKRALKIDTLFQAARVYARVAMDICNQEKKR